MADDALSQADEITYKRAYDALIDEGIITEAHGAEHFSVALLPAPFSISWQFLEDLDGGGQGSAKKVQRFSDGIAGVLKIPRSADSIATERFRREVSILQNTTHPSIVRLLDVNLDPSRGAIGYVTPLGVPLDHYWNLKVPSLSPSQRYDAAYDIILQISDGIGLLHAKGVVHRDLKPENIIIINDRPVIIDFGVALRPQDERLSAIDQRVVANSFATPPSAHYGLHDSIPAWDCLGLAWIYGFLVGEGKRPKQFHWRFHQLLEEPRRIRAKALLAACSHERTIPTDSKALVALMDQFRLGGGEHNIQPPSNASINAAIVANAEAQAALTIRMAEATEFAEVGIQLLEGPLTELRDALNLMCAGNNELPVAQNTYVVDDYQPPVMPKRPMQQILRQLSQGANQGFVSEQCIFSCTCGTGPRHFEIGTFVAYAPDFADDALQFRLILWCRIAGGKPPEWPEMLFNFGKDGSVLDAETGTKYSVREIADIAFRWMTEPKRWHALGAIRLS